MPAGFYSLKVDKITRETADSVSIRFLVPPPLKSMFAYKAGQYLTLHATINGEDIRRAYSVCESPYVDEMPTVAVKAVEDGRMSRFLNFELKEGDLIDAMPPMGKFTVIPDKARAVDYGLFGGGSGITPLKSILITVLKQEPLSKVTLFYANKDQESIIFKSALDEYASEYSNRFKIVNILDNPPSGWEGLSGMLSAPKIEQLVKQFMPSGQENQYFICGPGGLMALVKDTLIGMSIPAENVHLEYFSAVVHTEAEEQKIEELVDEGQEIITRKVQVEIYGDTQEIEVSPKKTILEAAMDAGMDPPFSCQVGVCTTCRAKVYKGKVRMDEREGLSDAEIDEGYVLTCQSHPLTDGVELVYE